MVGCRSYSMLLWRMVNSATPWEIHWFGYFLSWGQYNKNFHKWKYLSVKLLFWALKTVVTLVYFFTLFNEFITGCIPQVVFLALFLQSLCSAWSILHWANFILPLWVSHLEVEEAGLFHAYWAISSYGLCFCRCFLTGFDHKCSLPRNDFLLALFNTVAHRGHAANKKVAANKK